MLQKPPRPPKRDPKKSPNALQINIKNPPGSNRSPDCAQSCPRANTEHRNGSQNYPNSAIEKEPEDINKTLNGKANAES